MSSDQDTGKVTWQKLATYGDGSAQWYAGLPDGTWLRVVIDVTTPGKWLWSHRRFVPGAPEVITETIASGERTCAEDARAEAEAHAKAAAS